MVDCWTQLEICLVGKSGSCASEVILNMTARASAKDYSNRLIIFQLLAVRAPASPFPIFLHLRSYLPISKGQTVAHRRATASGCRQIQPTTPFAQVCATNESPPAFFSGWAYLVSLLRSCRLCLINTTGRGTFRPWKATNGPLRQGKRRPGWMRGGKGSVCTATLLETTSHVPSTEHLCG